MIRIGKQCDEDSSQIKFASRNVICEWTEFMRLALNMTRAVYVWYLKWANTPRDAVKVYLVSFSRSVEQRMLGQVTDAWCQGRSPALTLHSRGRVNADKILSEMNFSHSHRNTEAGVGLSSHTHRNTEAGGGALPHSHRNTEAGGGVPSSGVSGKSCFTLSNSADGSSWLVELFHSLMQYYQVMNIIYGR